MKTKKTLFIILASATASHAAMSVTGVADFTSLNGTDTTIDINGDSLGFSSSNVGGGADQGSGVILNLSDTFTPVDGDILFFEFSASVVSLEVDYVYGDAPSGVQSADAMRANANAFSVGIDEFGDVFARQEGNTILDFTDLSGLAQGTVVNFEIEVTVSDSTDFDADITASFDNGTSIISQTITDVSGNQNEVTDVSDFDFFAIGTQGLASGEENLISGFTASDMPIVTVSIPEPSTLTFSLLAAGSLLSIRRRKA